MNLKAISALIFFCLFSSCISDPIQGIVPKRDKVEYLCHGYCLRAANCGSFSWSDVEQRQICQTECTTRACIIVDCQEDYLGEEEVIDNCYTLIVFQACNAMGTPLPCAGVLN